MDMATDVQEALLFAAHVSTEDYTDVLAFTPDDFFSWPEGRRAEFWRKARQARNRGVVAPQEIVAHGLLDLHDPMVARVAQDGHAA